MGNNNLDAQVRVSDNLNMHTARQIVAGTGGLMACALITLGSMVGTQWVRDNSHVVFRLMGGLTLGCVCCFLFWFLTRERNLPPTVKNSGNFAARDNNGKMIGHVDHYYEAAAPEPKPIPATAPTEEKSLPNLIGRPELIQVRWTHVTWSVVNPGSPRATISAVLWVHNPAGDQLKKGSEIRSAIAALAYRRDGETFATVPTAFWLEASAYEVDFKRGQQQGVLLGIFQHGYVSPVWTAVENRRREKFRPKLHRIPVTGYTEVQFRIPDQIEVTILEDGNPLRIFVVLVDRPDGRQYRLRLAETDEA